MTVTASDLRAALARWAEAMHASTSELNALDAKLGDGDLGLTLDKCAANVTVAIASAPDRISDLLQASARACMEASGSSFGTLLAIGFMNAAKGTKGEESLEVPAIAELIKNIANAISARGGAKPGDKTFLDAVLAVQACLENWKSDKDSREQIQNAVSNTLTEFRSRPNRIGRAGMFGDRSVGLDDPGMVAFARMVDAV